MFRHDYPYTDFHELNMDWFLNEFKSLLEEWAEMDIKFDTLSDAVEALKTYVNNYFDNLNVQEEIDNKLDEMAQTGALSVLLRGYDFQEEMDIYPIGFRTNGLQCQGSQYVVYNDIPYLVVCYSAENEADDIIEKINLNTGLVVNSLSGNFGHCNGCCYHDGKIYIARGGGNATQAGKIHVLDFETFIEDEAIETSTANYAVSYNNGNFYTLSAVATKQIYIYDESFNYQSAITIDNTYAQSWQGFYVDDNYIYICEFRGPSGNGIDGIGIYFYNGLHKSFVKAPDQLEIEDMSVYGSNYLITCYTAGGVLALSCKLNQSGSNLGRSSYTPYRLATGDLTNAIYLDASRNNFLQNGTKSKPFSNWTAAIRSKLYKYGTTLTINVSGDFSDSTITLPSTSFYRQITITGTDPDSDKIGGIYIGSGNIIQITNLTISSLASNSRGYISIIAARLYLNNCKITGTGTEIGVHIDNGTVTATNNTLTDLNIGFRGIRTSLFNIGASNQYTNVTTPQENS